MKTMKCDKAVRTMPLRLTCRRWRSAGRAPRAKAPRTDEPTLLFFMVFMVKNRALAAVGVARPLTWVEKITDPLGRTIELDYDDAGRITSATLPDDKAMSATYDGNGNLTSISPPGRPAHGFGYTPMNLESRYSPPQPTPTIATPSTTYDYNDDGQLTKITRPDAGEITFAYDPNSGQLETQDLPGSQGQIDYTYHPETALFGAGMPHEITAPDGGKLTYAYGGRSLVYQEAWDGTTPGTFDGSVERVYDGYNRVVALTVNSDPNGVILNQFDADGFLTDVGDLELARDPNNGLLDGSELGVVTDTYTYNGFGEVTDYTAAEDANTVYDVTYVRDDGGRIKHRQESVDGGSAVDTHYKYDARGRLEKVCDDDACTSIRAQYVYDDNSNRTGGSDEVSGSISATYDNQDRLLSYNGVTYTYTANGELATKTDGSDVTEYEYDALGNLRHVELPDDTEIDYVIDGKNRRIGKKVDGNLVQGFLYEDQLRPIAELDPNGVVISRFVYGERPNVPEYIIKGGDTYRIIHDQVGSPRLVIDTATGDIEQKLEYDAFGNVQTDTNPGFQPFGFAGGIYDAHTNLVRFGARDYDPVVGRWTAKDPIGFAGGDANLYGYVSVDPVNAIDPSGLANSVEYFRIIALGAFAGAIGGLLSAEEGDDVACKMAAGAATGAAAAVLGIHFGIENLWVMAWSKTVAVATGSAAAGVAVGTFGGC